MQGPRVPRLALGGVALSPPSGCGDTTARLPAAPRAAAAPRSDLAAAPQLHLSLLSPAFELSTSAAENQQLKQEDGVAQQQGQQEQQAPWADEAAARLVMCPAWQPSPPAVIHFILWLTRYAGWAWHQNACGFMA